MLSCSVPKESRFAPDSALKAIPFEHSDSLSRHIVHYLINVTNFRRKAALQWMMTFFVTLLLLTDSQSNSPCNGFSSKMKSFNFLQFQGCKPQKPLYQVNFPWQTESKGVTVSSLQLWYGWMFVVESSVGSTVFWNMHEKREDESQIMPVLHKWLVSGIAWTQSTYNCWWQARPQ